MNGATVLRSVPHERKGLCPALDLGGNCSHALGRGRTDTAAIVPSRAVAWSTCRF